MGRGRESCFQKRLLTNITGKFIDVWLLQKPKLAHTGEGIECLVDDKFFRITESLLEQRLEDRGALPANISSNP